jgi:ABC-type phosphate/phosphonate transport system ATPase subunit
MLFVLVLVVLLLVLLQWVRSNKLDSVVIIGAMDSGKTTLFSVLRNIMNVATSTSIEPNQDTINNQRIVDFPGTQSKRYALSSYLKQAKAFVSIRCA